MTERVRWRTAREWLIIFLSIVAGATALSYCISFWRSVEIRLSGKDGKEMESIKIAVRDGRLSFQVNGIEDYGIRTEYEFLIFEYQVHSIMLGAPHKFGEAYLQYRLLRFPAWIVILLSATYPIIAFIRGPLRRRRRRKRGLCPTCGYNLTGNVTGVCPECAAKVEG